MDIYEQLAKPIEQGRLILLFGAGASLTSKDHSGNYLLSGKELAEYLANESELAYAGEDLQTVYSAVINKLGTKRVTTILEDLYCNTKPSDEYKVIASHCWRRIYTLNIDDALDNALNAHLKQKVKIRYKNDPIADKDSLYEFLDYVKLNGSSNRLHEGVIFSAKEYGQNSSITPQWYEELANDFFSNCFLFIGTQLNEPLFYHQIERVRFKTDENEQRSFVLVPSATIIEKESLHARNLIHIAGTLKDFTDWLSKLYSSPLSTIDIALNSNPRLRATIKSGDKVGEASSERLLENIVYIERDTLYSEQAANNEGKIRKFYKGYKPS